MKDMMSYKGYYGSGHYDDEDKIFHGRVEFIRSLITYEGTDVKSLRIAFEEAVNDYLELCEEEKKEPETPFKGSFNVRTGPDLHRRAALYAKSRGTNLNSVITDALEKYLNSAHPEINPEHYGVSSSEMSSFPRDQGNPAIARPAPTAAGTSDCAD